MFSMENKLDSYLFSSVLISEKNLIARASIYNLTNSVGVAWVGRWGNGDETMKLVCYL